MTIKPIATLLTDIATAIPDNTSGDVSPLDVRTSVIDTIDSFVALLLGDVEINSTAGPAEATLGSGLYAGQIVTVTMTAGANGGTLYVTNHVTIDPQVFLYSSVGDLVSLVWNGSEWATLLLSGATVQPDGPRLSGVDPTKVSYTESDPPTQVSANIVVTNVGGANLATATIEITGNYLAEDVLSYSGGVFAVGWAAPVLTLTGANSPTDYQTALRLVKYDNTNDSNPSLLTRTISFTVNDGVDDSNVVTKRIGVVGVSDPPVLASIEGGDIAYQEGDPATQITATIAITDVDDVNMESAVVAITGNFQTGEDVLAYVDTDITGVWSAGAGTMTLTGSDTIEAWETALRSVTYRNSSGTPSVLTRTISFTVNDGDDDSNTVTRDITVASTEVYGHFDSTTHYLTRTKVSEVSVANTFSVSLWFKTTQTLLKRFLFSHNWGVSDRLAIQANAASVRISAYDGTSYDQSETMDTDGTWHHVVATVNAAANTVIGYYDGVAMTGSSFANTSTSEILNVGCRNSTTTPIEFWDGGIKQIKIYDDVLTVGEALWLATNGASGSDPTATNLVYSWEFDEGTGTTIADGVGANDLTLVGNSDTFWGAPLLSTMEAGVIDFYEGDPDVQITNTLAISDDDGIAVVSAVVEITANFVTLEDVLTFSILGPISGVWSSSLGTMTLSGTDTAANYQAALRTVKYKNASADPTVTTRTISFTVNNGNDSNTLTRDISVAAIGGGPVPDTAPYLSSIFTAADNTRIEASAVTEVALATDYTICCHVKCNVAFADSTIMAISHNTSDRHGLYIDDQGAIGGGYWDGADTKKRGANASATLGVWYHLAMTYEQAGGTIKVYVDGAEVSETEGTQTFPATAITIFGASSDGVAHSNCNVLDARCYNEVKTAAEIAKIRDFIYEAIPRPTAAEDANAVSSRDGLVARWVFDGDVVEYIGGHHGTGYGFTPVLKTVNIWCDIDNEGGTENGTSLATAWGSIQEAVTNRTANDVVFIMDGLYEESVNMLGDVRLIGRTDAYDVPITIMEPADITLLWTAEAGIHEDCWSTTDLPVIGNLSYGDVMLPRLGQHYLGNSPTADPRALHGFTILGSAVGFLLDHSTEPDGSTNLIPASGDGNGFDLWGEFGGIWGQSEDFATDGKTYIRFSDGTDPNTVTLKGGGGGSGGNDPTANPGIYAYGDHNVTVERIKLRGYYSAVMARQANNITVRYCEFIANIYGCFSYWTGEKPWYADNIFNWGWAGPLGGAWGGGSSYNIGLKEINYIWQKRFANDGNSHGAATNLFNQNAVGQAGPLIERNTITSTVQGMMEVTGCGTAYQYPSMDGAIFRNNIIRNCSSLGMTFNNYQFGSLYHGNEIDDCNSLMRGELWTRFTPGAGTEIYVFDNKFHNPEGLGTGLYFFVYTTSFTIDADFVAYFFHNSFSGGATAISHPFYLNLYLSPTTGKGGLPFVHFLNNVFSCPVFTGTSAHFNNDDPDARPLGTFDYNWCGGPTNDALTQNSGEAWWGANNVNVGDDTYIWPLTGALTQLTIDGDSTTTPSAAIENSGAGSPYWSDISDAPDGLSADWVANDNTETTGTAWFTLSAVDADFFEMRTLNIDVDIESDVFSGGDTCVITARIYDSATATNPLTDESPALGSDTDTTRVQRQVAFSGLTGTAAQWATAQIRFTWTYAQSGGPDNDSVRLYGVSLDGTYESTTPPTWIIPGSHAAEGTAKVITPAFSLGGTNFTDNIQPNAEAIDNIASPPDMGAVNL